MIKNIHKLGTERNFLNMIRSIYEKVKANIMFNGKRLNALPPKMTNKTRLTAFTIAIQYCTVSSIQDN